MQTTQQDSSIQRIEGLDQVWQQKAILKVLNKKSFFAVEKKNNTKESFGY